MCNHMREIIWTIKNKYSNFIKTVAEWSQKRLTFGTAASNIVAYVFLQLFPSYGQLLSLIVFLWNVLVLSMCIGKWVCKRMGWPEQWGENSGIGIVVSIWAMIWYWFWSHI